MHQGAFARANEGGEGSGGWWPTSPSLRWAGRSITPASSPPTTRRTCPATASPQAAGTAPAPLRWGWRAKHRRRASGGCSRAAIRRLASCSAVHMAGTPCRPSTWCCGRPRASRFSMASVMRLLAGRCWGRTTPVSARRSPTWTNTWVPAATTVVSNTCLDRGCWRSAMTTGRPEKATRCCILIWSSPTASRGRTDGGQPWTAAIFTGTGWLRTPSTLPGHLPTRAHSDTRGGVDGG
jgi:hypothetical protein